MHATTWTELHTHWGDGNALRARVQQALDATGPDRLHLVVLCPTAPAVADAPADWADLLDRAQTSGVHHQRWDGGRVQLDLWRADWQATVPELRLSADTMVVGDTAWADGPQALALCKALTRCSRRGTRLCMAPSSAPAPAAWAGLWQRIGWQQDAQAPGTLVFDPAWPIKTDREPWRAWVRAPGHCAVVGAGLAGAAVAAALAQAGWQVTVLDRADHAASGASGLPVGLAAPYASADDNLLSRLTRQGVRALQAQAHARLVPGQDWAPSGAHELPLGSAPAAMAWQHEACWVKPGALVQAWLATPGVCFQASAQVQRVVRAGSAWSLLNAEGAELARADRVVLAGATDVQALLALSPDLGAAEAGRGWPPLHAVRGLVSWGRHDTPERRPFPPYPVHGHGSLIAHVPFADGKRWFVGASYQPVHAGDTEWPDDKNHGANALRLERLAPALFAALTPVLEAGALQAWKGQRCVSADRLPLLGPLSPGLPDVWVCAGFGSRGLSLVALCADLLAAQWAGRPWPMSYSLACALLPYRKRL